MADVNIYTRLLGGSEVVRGLASMQSAAQGFAAKLGAALGVSLSIGGLIAFTRSLANTAEELLRLSRTTGMTVETLSKLQYASKIVDVEFSSMTMSTRFMAHALVEAQKPGTQMSRMFNRLGLDAKELAKNTDEAFITIGEAIAKSGTARDDLRKVFGRAGVELLPAFGGELRAVMAEAERAGWVISTKTALAGDELNDSIARVSMGMRSWITMALQPAMPILAGLGRELVSTANNTEKMAAAGDNVVTSLQAVMVFALRTKAVFSGFGAELGTQTGRLEEFLRIQDEMKTKKGGILTWNELKQAWQQANVAMEGLKDTAGDTDVAMKAFADAPKRVAANVKKYMAESASDLAKYLAQLKKGKGTAEDEEEQKKAESALESLKKMNEALNIQVIQFNKGSAAAKEYEITHGDLAKAVGNTADAQRKSILEQTRLLESLATRKELEEDLIEIERAASEKAAERATAIRSELDEMFKLNQMQREMTDLIGKGYITASMGAAVVARERVRLLTEETDKILENLSMRERMIDVEKQTGATSDFEAMLRLGRARQQATEQLKALIALKKQDIVLSGDTTAIRAIDELEMKLRELEASSNVLGDRIKSTFQSAFSDSMMDIIHQTKTVSEAFKSMGQKIIDTMLDIALQAAANEIWKVMAPAIASIGGSLFGFASGGSFKVAGGGGTDSQLVSFMATPGEEVSVRTPGQQASRGRSGGGDSLSVVLHQTVNVGNGVDVAQVRVAMLTAKEQAKSEIMQSIRSRGAFSRAMA